MALLMSKFEDFIQKRIFSPQYEFKIGNESGNTTIKRLLGSLMFNHMHLLCILTVCINQDNEFHNKYANIQSEI